jgi:hypothetical protein
MTEIVFLVEDAPEGGYTARALGESIFTEADDLQSLREMVKDAVNCHYDDRENRPKIIRLHTVRVIDFCFFQIMLLQLENQVFQLWNLPQLVFPIVDRLTY